MALEQGPVLHPASHLCPSEGLWEGPAKGPEAVALGQGTCAPGWAGPLAGMGRLHYAGAPASGVASLQAEQASSLQHT